MENPKSMGRKSINLEWGFTSVQMRIKCYAVQLILNSEYFSNITDLHQNAPCPRP
jgi:hypothetical protein